MNIVTACKEVGIIDEDFTYGLWTGDPDCDDYNHRAVDFAEKLIAVPDLWTAVKMADSSFLWSSKEVQKLRSLMGIVDTQVVVDCPHCEAPILIFDGEASK